MIPSFYTGAGNADSGFHVLFPRTSPTQSSPQPRYMYSLSCIIITVKALSHVYKKEKRNSVPNDTFFTMMPESLVNLMLMVKINATD